MSDMAPSLPEEFIKRLEMLIPTERLASVIASFSQTKPLYFRINTLKTTIEKMLAQFPMAKPVEGFENVFRVDADHREQLTHSQAMADGLIYLQSLPSLLVPLVLAPQPGEEILDLAAAPGSKTTQIALLMKNEGRIAAVEKIKGRFFKLKDNCSRQGITCIDFYCKDGSTVWRHCENRFDRVLLDAPCSSEGRFNTEDPSSWQFWSERKVKEMARKQWPLLYSAFRSLKPGGILVYSTCTYSREENEDQIAKLIKKFPGEVALESFTLPIANTMPGLEPAPQAKRILPTDEMEGFFICRIKKSQA